MLPTDSQKILAAVADERLRRDRGRLHPSSARPRTPVFIIASPRPHVGKTFLARLLIDFLRLNGGSTRAFDLAPGADALQDYLPGVTMAADIGETQGQVALFDRLILDDGIAKVIDLGSASYQRFFSIAEEIGFVAESQRRSIEPVILFAADAHPASVQAYGNLQRRFREAVLVPAFNEAIAQERKLRGQFPFVRAASAPLQIPFLAPGLKVHADKSPHSFADFHDQLPAQVPIALAFELRTWTRRTFLEFRELELRLLLEKLRGSLPGVSF